MQHIRLLNSEHAVLMLLFFRHIGFHIVPLVHLDTKEEVREAIHDACRQSLRVTSASKLLSSTSSDKTLRSQAKEWEVLSTLLECAIEQRFADAFLYAYRCIKKE